MESLLKASTTSTSKACGASLSSTRRPSPSAHAHVAPAVAPEREHRVRALGEARHVGVDLEEAEHVAGTAPRRERPDAEADHPDAHRPARQALRVAADRQPRAARGAVVGRQLRPARGRRKLQAVGDLAVEQLHVLVRLARLLAHDPQDAIEAAGGEQEAALLPHRVPEQGPAQCHDRQHGRDPQLSRCRCSSFRGASSRPGLSSRGAPAGRATRNPQSQSRSAPPAAPQGSPGAAPSSP